MEMLAVMRLLHQKENLDINMKFTVCEYVGGSRNMYYQEIQWAVELQVMWIHVSQLNLCIAEFFINLHVMFGIYFYVVIQDFLSKCF